MLGTEKKQLQLVVIDVWRGKRIYQRRRNLNLEFLLIQNPFMLLI